MSGILKEQEVHWAGGKGGHAGIVLEAVRYLTWLNHGDHSKESAFYLNTSST